jgi:hypothetical protein
MKDSHEDDWTTEERRMLDALPRERVPSAALKQRTLDAIKASRNATPNWWTTRALVLAAAASLIFIAGAIVGFAAARHAAPPPPEPPIASTTGQAVARSDAPANDNQQTRHVVWY